MLVERHPSAGIVDGHEVLEDIHVAGTLTFARDRDTLLGVGLIKIQPGDDASENGFDCDAHLPKRGHNAVLPALEVGTPAEVTANPAVIEAYLGKRYAQDHGEWPKRIVLETTDGNRYFFYGFIGESEAPT